MVDTPDPRTLERLEWAIRKLQPDQHAVFCAVRYDELTYAQVAVRTGRTVGEVEHLLARALAAITLAADRPPPRRWWRFR